MIELGVPIDAITKLGMEILETAYVYGDVLELRRYGRRISFPNTRNVSIFAKAVCFINSLSASSLSLGLTLKSNSNFLYL